jgi:hypothetical protein
VTVVGFPPLRVCRRSRHGWPATARPTGFHLYWSLRPTSPRWRAMPRALLLSVRSRSTSVLTAAASAMCRGSCQAMKLRLGPARGACTSLWIADRTRAAWCGLTFELKPTTEVGGVRLDCDDAPVPQASLTLPAVVGRRLERGVRPHPASVPERGRGGAADHGPNSTLLKVRSCSSRWGVTVFGFPPLRACRRSRHERLATARRLGFHLYSSSCPTLPRWLKPPRTRECSLDVDATQTPIAAASAVRRGACSARRSRLGTSHGACAAPWIAARTRAAWCGLTFELKPTTEVGGVRLDCDDARVPQASLTLPAVVGRRLERGVRPRLASVPERD